MSKVATQNKLERFRRLLKAVKAESVGVDSPIFQKALGWLKEFPAELKIAEKDELRNLVLEAFNLTSEELLKHALPEQLSSPQTHSSNAKEIEDSLWKLVPKGGFFRYYCDYTSHVETPLAFHLFGSMCLAGAIIGRRLWFDMGYYTLFPNLSVVLIAPSGLCAKTVGADIGIRLIQKLGVVKIYSEKMTPEALLGAMTGSAAGLLYAPEFSAFASKQRYNDGLIPLLTRLLDNPEYFCTETITRKKEELKEVALSALFASTLSGFIKDTPEGTFGGGFTHRLLIVVQEDTCREEALPEPPKDMEPLLLTHLIGFRALSGQMSLQTPAREYWVARYHEFSQALRLIENDSLRGYARRRPDRILKIAMLLHMSEHHSMAICLECLQRADSLAIWAESFLPGVIKQMFRTQSGEEQEFILQLINKYGGLVDHSTLIRRAQYKMNAGEIKIVVKSLIEAGQIKEVHDATAHYYTMLEKGISGD